MKNSGNWTAQNESEIKFDPNGAKVEDSPDPKQQEGCRSRLLRVFDNEGDGVSSAFPKGKQKGILSRKNILLTEKS